jgi:hypothetical protein
MTLAPAAASFAALLGILQVTPPVGTALSSALREFAYAMPVLLAAAALSHALGTEAAAWIRQWQVGRLFAILIVGIPTLWGDLAFLRGVRGLIDHSDPETGRAFFITSVVLGVAVLTLVLGLEVRHDISRGGRNALHWDRQKFLATTAADKQQIDSPSADDSARPS